MKFYKMYLGEVSIMQFLKHESYGDELDDELLKGKPINDWKSFEVETETEGKHTGFASFTGGSSLWRKDIVDLVMPLIGHQVQILPVQHLKYDYYAINILNIVDVINHGQSISERNEILDLLRYYEVYVFDQNRWMLSGQPHIFRIPESIHTTLVTEDFVNTILENEIEGIFFELLYDTETWEDPDPRITKKYCDFISRHIEVGVCYSWEEVVDGVQQGKAYASAHWKVQLTEYGDRIFGQLRRYLDYHFFLSTNVPKELFTLKWYEVERTNI